MTHYRTLAGLLCLTLVSFSDQAMAQSTIFNVPTTDTATKGTLYGEFDFLVQAPGPDVSRTYIYNPRLVIGGPGDLEFGVNLPVYSTGLPGDSPSNVYIQPNAKWKLYDNRHHGLAVAVGGLVNMPLNNRDSQDSWGLLYGVLSKKVATGDHWPRLHFGPYGIVSANQDPADGPVSFVGPRGGVILGYEQLVHKGISIVADWYSGTNGLGYLTTGISIVLPGRGLLNAAYSIGNDSWKDDNATRNRFSFIYYGVVF